MDADQTQWEYLVSVLKEKPLVYIKDHNCHIGLGEEKEIIRISQALLRRLLLLSIVINRSNCPSYCENFVPRFVLLEVKGMYVCLNAHTLLRYTRANNKGIFVLITTHIPELYNNTITASTGVSVVKIGNHLAPFGFSVEKKNHVINVYYHEMRQGNNFVSYKLKDRYIKLYQPASGDQGNTIVSLYTYKVLGELQSKCPSKLIKSFQHKVDDLLSFWSVLNDLLIHIPYKHIRHSRLKELIPSVQDRDNKRILGIVKDNEIIGNDFAHNYLKRLYAYHAAYGVWPLQRYPEKNNVNISKAVIEKEQEICAENDKNKPHKK